MKYEVARKAVNTHIESLYSGGIFSEYCHYEFDSDNEMVRFEDRGDKQIFAVSYKKPMVFKFNGYTSYPDPEVDDITDLDIVNEHLIKIAFNLASTDPDKRQTKYRVMVADYEGDLSRENYLSVTDLKGGNFSLVTMDEIERGDGNAVQTEFTDEEIDKLKSVLTINWDRALIEVDD